MIVKESNDTTRNFGIEIANIQRKIDETNRNERASDCNSSRVKWINWKKRNVG
jgi:hypothetical protein